MNAIKQKHTIGATEGETISELNNRANAACKVETVQNVIQAAGYAVRNAADLIEKLNDDGQIDGNLLRFLFLTIQQNGDLIANATLEYDKWSEPFCGIKNDLTLRSPVAGGECLPTIEM